MALAYVPSWKGRSPAGGLAGLRHCASWTAAAKRHLPTDAPLLPYRDQGGPGGFHSQPKPIPYTEEQAKAIIAFIAPQDPIAARLLRLMWVGGMRVSEATWLRSQDIDLEDWKIWLNQDGNANRTKGGRQRPTFCPGQRFAESRAHLMSRKLTISLQSGWAARQCPAACAPPAFLRSPGHWHRKTTAWKITGSPDHAGQMTARHCWRLRTTWGITGWT
jgi:integrase